MSEAVCTCPPERNSPHCPVDGRAWRARVAVERIFCEIAWELDLNWSCDTADRLFWQHARVPGWGFDNNSLRYPLRNVNVGPPAWILFKMIARPGGEPK